MSKKIHITESQYQLIREGAAIVDIQRAINNHNIVELEYDDGISGKRMVEVYALGTMPSGSSVIRAYQISGPTKTRNNEWKIFRLDTIRSFKVTDQVFTKARPKFNKNGDKTFRNVKLIAKFDRSFLQKAGDFLNRGVDKVKSIFKSHYHQELIGNDKLLVERFLKEHDVSIMLDESGNPVLYQLLSEEMIFGDKNFINEGLPADLKIPSDGTLKKLFGKKVWFHGSKNDNLSFDEPKTGKARASKMQLDFGTHFSSSDYASTYGALYPVFLNYKNPLDLTKAVWGKNDKNFNKIYKLIHDLRLQREYESLSYYDLNGNKQSEIATVSLNAFKLDKLPPSKVQNALLKNGFDSVIYNPYHPQGAKHYIPQDLSVIILKKENIKEIPIEEFISVVKKHNLNKKGGNNKTKNTIKENVIDNNKIWYHGTNTDITANELKQSYLAGDYGEGIYLTSSENEARKHGKNILKMTITSPKPLVIGSKNYFKDIYPEISNNGVPKMYMVAPIATRMGYTSIIIEKPESYWNVLLNGSKINSLNETINFGKREKDIKDEWNDEVIGKKTIQTFNFKDEIGGTAYGNIENGVASIIGMNSIPRGKEYSQNDPTLKRRGFFKALLWEFVKHNINSVKISMQSQDTRAAVRRLLEKGILHDPKEMTGISVDLHPTLFKIDAQKLKSDIFPAN